MILWLLTVSSAVLMIGPSIPSAFSLPHFFSTSSGSWGRKGENEEKEN
jgi:hypothetical protein